MAATLYLSSNMSRNRTSSPQGFDNSLLDPGGLTTRDGLRDALRSVERVCYGDDSFKIAEMIEELNSQPHTFEYITSSMFLTLVITIHLTKKNSYRFGQPNFREIIKVGSHPVSHTWHTQCNGRFWDQTLAATILFPDVSGRHGDGRTS